MRSTSDPNELASLTQLANTLLQEHIRKAKIAEFATSSKWAASAVVVQLEESRGFHVRVGFELRTPWESPFQDLIIGWGPNPEEAVKAAVNEWLELALPAARAIHSDKDARARLGETTVGDRVYSWRMAAGSVRVTGDDAGQVNAQLAQSDLFTRLNLGVVVPWQREVPWLCVKLHLARPFEGGPVCEARISGDDWPQGTEYLRRFVLPGDKPLDVRQYLFLRRTGKRAVATAPRPAAVPATPAKTATPAQAPPGAARPAAGEPAPESKKPWWKVW